MIPIEIWHISHFWAFITCIILFLIVMWLIIRVYLYNYPLYIAKFNINSHQGNKQDKNIINKYHCSKVLIVTLCISIVCIDYKYDLKLSGWISAVGTISAVFVALIKNDILHPRINIGVNGALCQNKMHKGYLIIQFLNRSSVTAFMRINQIYLTNNNKGYVSNKKKDKAVPIDAVPTLNHLYFPIKAYETHNMVIFNEKKKNMHLMYFLKRYNKRYKYLVINLQNSRSGKMLCIKILLKKLFNKKVSTSKRLKLLQGAKILRLK